MFGFGKKKDELLAPFAGQVVAIDQVPDPVFAQKMLGDGFAIIPDEQAASIEVVAPVAGKLVQVFGTKHAFAIVASSGLELLVHIGLDTVELAGAGFEVLAEVGSEVAAGQPIIRVDLGALREAGRNPITPVVCTDLDQVAELTLVSDQVAAGAKACVVTLA